EIDRALGGRRMVLDWEKMDLEAKSRAQVIAELDRNLPKSFPNHLPTITHSVAWENVDPRMAMRSYLSTPVMSFSFERAASDLRVAISRRVSSPRYYDVDIDQPVYLFDSNGDMPPQIPGDRNGNPADLVAKVRAKIAADMEAMGGARIWRSTAGMPQVMSDLFLARSSLYAPAPPTSL